MPTAASTPPLRPPAQVVRGPSLRGQYLAPIVWLRAEEPRYLGDDRFRSEFLELSAAYLSFAGAYAQAHSYADRVHTPGEDLDAPRTLPAGASLTPAVQAIVREAAGRRAVFVNEAHHVPQHRAFSIELLRRLREEGFTVFAAEMISPEDTLLLERGYPAAGETGMYTDEPLAADLVREAIRLGYRIVAYDGPFRCEPREDDPLFCPNERERRQAAALSAILAGDPAARLFVHEGYAHVYEEARGEWIPMAVRFRELSGEDPLTVDQTVMTEHAAREHEHPLYQAVARRAKAPVAVRDGEGGWLVQDALVDVQVVHPRTRLVRGRPHWLPTERRRVTLPLPPVRGPVLLQAFYAAEGPDAVPADQVLAEPGAAVPPLALAPGEYRIVALGEAGPAEPERRIRVDRRGRVRTRRPRHSRP